MNLAQFQALGMVLIQDQLVEHSENSKPENKPAYKIVFEYSNQLYAALPFKYDFSVHAPSFTELSSFKQSQPTVVNEDEDNLCLIKAYKKVVSEWYPREGFKTFFGNDTGLLFKTAVQLVSELEGDSLDSPLVDVDVLSTNLKLDFMYLPQDAVIKPISLITSTSEN
ncbi:hypothetical protein IWT140_02228 [Secundilactobacillus pentosiphilus]|uniref:Uncharacterized protein n=1 Tax=Secundilactobacillus pentosiphilus TaxID=1714682 RepID=A0A1Z5ISD9_9LACO|nr:hypothetical protein [Secundilactobacillus pentosiphilus]GAX04586.1 hypothetical protein IWT140_02228 [Secundilactobacillus pentosiphilus]